MYSMAEEVIKDKDEEKKSLNFIEQKIEKDLAEGKNGGRVQTRYPSLTAISTSDMPRRLPWTSVWPSGMAAHATSASTIPTP